jgi:hypothetical protein
MVSKKSIVDNELMREVIAIRIDTLWKMIGQKTQNRLPEIEEEGATGKFDNKGAIFIPGGLIYQDADEQKVRYESRGGMSGPEFREKVRSAMRFDNAILLYPDGLAAGINLDNGFFPKPPDRF